MSLDIGKGKVSAVHCISFAVAMPAGNRLCFPNFKVLKFTYTFNLFSINILHVTT